jgi:hypothetical protein
MRNVTRSAIAILLVAGTLLLSIGCGPRRETPIADAPSEKSAPSTQPIAQPAAVSVLETGNGLAVRNGGSAPTVTLDKPATVTNLTTYHFKEGGGPAPGTIGLQAADGTMHGPWQAKGLDGQGGAKNAFWETRPAAKLPAGTYNVVDSSPQTWSTNDQAKGVGFTTMLVVYDE